MPDSHNTSGSQPIDLTGQQLGDYQLLRRLGRGGMADVYLAKQISLQRNVALKILKPDLAKDESYVKRFEREAQAAAALVQANIVQIYEVGQSQDYHFIAQEYVPGRNLRQYIERHGAVESVMAINVLRQSALALQKADELGVIHRDIKPENIMLSTKGEVKVTDFGLARIKNNRSEQALTQIGVTMGTPLYMSPEQVGGLTLDHRSDIYSLGITGYHMLAGKPPFDADNALAIAVQHVNDSAADLSTIRPDVPPELTKIIMKMISKKPAERQQNAKEVLKDLRRVKVDVDDDWEMIIEKLSASESIIHTDTSSWSQAQLAATRQLQMVMQGNIRSWWRSKALWITSLVLGIAAVFGGVYAANATKPTSLLDITDIDNELVPKKEDIVAQFEAYRWVSEKQKERYLKAVLEYYPETGEGDEQYTKRLYNRHAKARLGEIYIREQRWEEARTIYEEFAGVEDIAPQFQTLGFGGSAIVYEGFQSQELDSMTDDWERKITDCVAEVNGKEEYLKDYPFIEERFDTLLERLKQEQIEGQ